MEDKVEIVELSPSTSILDEPIINFISGIVGEEPLVGVLSVDNKNIDIDDIVPDGDITQGFDEDYDVVQTGKLNESVGVYLKRKDGRSMFITNANVVDKCKLYEYNSRINDFYAINAIIINSLVHNVFINKIKTQSIKNNVAYADIVIKRLKARGTHKAYIAVSSLIYDLFLNPSKEYSLQSMSANTTEFKQSHREYLSDVIGKIRNNPRDLSFFSEDDVKF